MPRLTKRRITLLIGILVVMLTGGAVWIFLSAPSMDKRDLNDVDAVVELAGRHYLLPTNETPALATVEDKTKLSSEFLRAAEDGDKLLVYKNAKKVLLYRPSVDKIVEVGPVSIAPPGTADDK